MASRKAREFLAANGIVVDGHNATECSNFATGRGTGKLASPYHIVEVNSRYGTSKRTVGWARTKLQANDLCARLNRIERSKRDNRTGLPNEPIESGRGGAEYHDSRRYYYVIDVRTNKQE